MTRPPHWAEPLGADVARAGRIDALIVGSGAGAAPVGLTLARAGYRVLVLEKGPAYNQSDFVYDEIRQCRRDFFLPSMEDEPHVRVGSKGPQRTNAGWIACCVGGGTVHFSGFTYRLHPEDLRLRSLLGEVRGTRLADWPIAWEELEPYYERAEYELGVSGDARRNPFDRRRRPLPLPPLRENGLAQLIDRTCQEMGLHAYPTARAILSRPWNGRAACRHSFFCGSYGCETSAKSSVLAALWPEALATGNCRIQPLSMVTKVESDAAGRVTGVQYIDAAGRSQRVHAPVVVVACSAVESARLLLLSEGPAHPQGLANASGLVGRNLMFMGFGSAEADFERSDPRMQKIDWGEPFVNRSVQDYYLFDRDTPEVRKGGTIDFLLPHANPIFSAERLSRIGGGLWGKALKDKIRRTHRDLRRLAFEIFSETLPLHDSRVTLDPEVKDRYGLPVARMSLLRHLFDRENNSRVVDRALEIMRAMKPLAVREIDREGLTYWLQAGTCRFGDDAENAVLDRDCRAHTAPNLFVTDGSFMPTSGGVPNTLTIEANAFRVGDRIVALGKSHDLFRRPGKVKAG